MNLTIEQMREIVDGAPEGATEYRKLSCTTRYVRVGEKFAERSCEEMFSDEYGEDDE